jgi:PAS domain S-box-containing protein
MPDCALGDEIREAIARRTRDLFQEQHRTILRRTDRLFASLLAAEGIAAIATAARIAPAPGGPTASPVLLAGASGGGAVLLALRWPGRIATRHVLAVVQMLISVLLIHLWGDRIETHFLIIFGSLAFLVFYRDWWVLATATLVVVADHYLRAIPASVGSWPSAEYLGWIAFEDVFLILFCVQSTSEMKKTAGRQALLEATRARIEQTAALRTAELNYQADELVLLTYQLRQSEAELRKLALVASRTDNAVILTDALGRIEWVNDGFTRLMGYPLDEVLGRTPISFLRSDDPGGPARLWSKVRQGEGFHTEIVVATKGGTIRWIAAEVQPIPDKSGMLIHFMAIDSDITERERAEERTAELVRVNAALQVEIAERRQAEEEYARALRERQNITDAIPDLLYVLDLEGRLVCWNRKYESVTGYSPEELCQKHFIEFAPESERERVIQAARTAYETGYVKIEVDLLRKDGSTVPYQFTGVPLRDQAGQILGLTGIGRDISERERAGAAGTS